MRALGPVCGRAKRALPEGEIAMPRNSQETEHDALHHIQHVSQMLETVISHVHGDLGKLDDPKAIALLQSAGDVLLKLKASFDEFEEGWSSPAAGQFVIQRASESRNEFWTGSGWS